MTTFNSNLEGLKSANKQRCKEYGHEIKDWTPTDWGCALAGEVGELCNVLKKLHRGDYNTEEMEKFKENAGDEIADVLIYLDLLSQRLEINLSEEMVRKFNKDSKKRGLKTFLNRRELARKCAQTVPQTIEVTRVHHG